jgi:2-methylaconitate cis-trans-isomerase PrpF
MAQRRIPAVFMRGGTSKGVFFHERDLPVDRAARDRLFLAVLGSPDPYGRQLNGMGGGVSSLSKAVIIAPSARPGADIDYTFAQVAVGSALVDYGGTCGNLASAVGPFAVDEGLVTSADGEVAVRIHATNTGKLIIARFAMAGGEAAVEGDLALPGVAGTGAPVRLEFVDPGGAGTGKLLPTGLVAEDLDLGPLGTVRVSSIDAANPCVFIAAEDIGLTGAELPTAIDADLAAMAKLEAVRAAAGVRMGFGATPDEVTRQSPASPKVAIIAAPLRAALLDGSIVEAGEMDITVRMLSMGVAHKAVPLTGALCLAVAARIPGSMANQAISPTALGNRALRIGTPSGVFPVDADVELVDGGYHARGASVYRTARRLMEGSVLAPASALDDA